MSKRFTATLSNRGHKIHDLSGSSITQTILSFLCDVHSNIIKPNHYFEIYMDGCDQPPSQALPFSVLSHQVNKIKYGKNWRNKEQLCCGGMIDIRLFPISFFHAFWSFPSQFNVFCGQLEYIKLCLGAARCTVVCRLLQLLNVKRSASNIF